MESNSYDCMVQKASVSPTPKSDVKSTRRPFSTPVLPSPLSPFSDHLVLSEHSSTLKENTHLQIVTLHPYPLTLPPSLPPYLRKTRATSSRPPHSPRDDSRPLGSHPNTWPSPSGPRACGGCHRRRTGQRLEGGKGRREGGREGCIGESQG